MSMKKSIQQESSIVEQVYMYVDVMHECFIVFVFFWA